MADRNEKCLSELLKYTGNNVCADCGARSKLFYCKNDLIMVSVLKSMPPMLHGSKQSCIYVDNFVIGLIFSYKIQINMSSNF